MELYLKNIDYISSRWYKYVKKRGDVYDKGDYRKIKTKIR